MFFYFANLIENNDIKKVIQVSKTIELLVTVYYYIKSKIGLIILNTKNLNPISHATMKMIF